MLKKRRALNIGDRRNWMVEVVLDGVEDEPGERPRAYFQRFVDAVNEAQRHADDGNEVNLAEGPDNHLGQFRCLRVKPGQDVRWLLNERDALGMTEHE